MERGLVQTKPLLHPNFRKAPIVSL